MRPAHWIAAHGEKRRAIAARLRVVESTWSRMLRGELRPDADVVEEFRRYTGGSVTAQDWHEVRLEWLADHPRKEGA